jgi:hypothetical protein
MTFDRDEVEVDFAIPPDSSGSDVDAYFFTAESAFPYVLMARGHLANTRRVIVEADCLFSVYGPGRYSARVRFPMPDKERPLGALFLPGSLY